MGWTPEYPSLVQVDKEEVVFEVEKIIWAGKARPNTLKD